MPFPGPHQLVLDVSTSQLTMVQIKVDNDRTVDVMLQVCYISIQAQFFGPLRTVEGADHDIVHIAETVNQLQPRHPRSHTPRWRVLPAMMSWRSYCAERLAKGGTWCFEVLMSSELLGRFRNRRCARRRADPLDRLTHRLDRTLDGQDAAWSQIQVALVESSIAGDLATGLFDLLDSFARPLSQFF